MIKLILQKIYRLFGRELSEEQWHVYDQFVGFALVGVSNFFVSYGTYARCLFIGFNYHVSNILAFAISVLNSYFWNNRYVFREGGEGGGRVWWKVLIRTYLSYAFTGLVLTEILLFVEINLLGLPKLAGPLINLFITTPINFFINKCWAFRSERD